MRTNAVHNDIDGVGTGVRRTFRSNDLARRPWGTNVERERIIRCTESFPKFVVTHVAGPEYAFFGWLHDQHQRTAPFIFAGDHLPCCADKARNMYVVTTGVHNRNDISGYRISLLCPRSVG